MSYPFILIPEFNYIQLSVIWVNWGKVTDNPKPQLKQKQSLHGTKWI
jgi:hypothetical protein